MDLNNLKNQALNKLREASHNEQVTDTGLDKASEAAKKVTGGKYNDKIDQARNSADNYLGSKQEQQKNEQAPANEQNEQDSPAQGEGKPKDEAK